MGGWGERKAVPHGKGLGGTSGEWRVGGGVLGEEGGSPLSPGCPGRPGGS